MNQITTDPHIGGLNTDRSRKSSDHHALFDGDGNKHGSKSLNGYKRGIRGELLKRAWSNPSSAKSKLPDELLEEDYVLFGWMDCCQHVSGKNGWTKKFFAINDTGDMWMGTSENMAELQKVDLQTSMIQEVLESEHPLVFQVSDKLFLRADQLKTKQDWIGAIRVAIHKKNDVKSST
uniref:PH domain-containing protein n=1 Tax=Guillardia theta TaxID=55529 RepID=A0A6U6B7S2_GUITH|mmetsp:Transcript_34179/g.107077  ORF Transcript_34179/g.107077 Transcript_34179/m.107077 type:complete len:177 (+) Transcript_34179:124-654(+)